VRTRSAQCLEKTLEGAQIKISSVLTDLLGASGRAMIGALVGGERHSGVLARLAKGRSRARIPELINALHECFGEHHAFLCGQHLGLLDELATLLDALTRRIEDAMRPWEHQIALLETIPGSGARAPRRSSRRSGAAMAQFPAPGRLA